jgi:hypothetical protein
MIVRIKNYKMWYINVFVLLGINILWQYTQKLLSCDIIADGQIVDRIHTCKRVNKIGMFLENNIIFTKYLIILTSLLIDIGVLYVSYEVLFFDNFKLLAEMFTGLMLRQLCQFINRLPTPRNMIWFDPGFPSLTVTYGTSNDFFFSGHTYMALLAGSAIFSNPYIITKTYAVLFVILEVGFVLVTRGHYMMDVYAAVTTFISVKYLLL